VTQPNRDRKVRPIRKIEDAGHAVMTLNAQSSADAKAHLIAQLHMCDGYGERGDTVAVSTSGITSTTANAALESTELRRRIEASEQRDKDLIAAIHAHHWANQADLRYRAPKDVVQPTKPEHCHLTDATRPGSIEWWNSECVRDIVTRGLCRTHYDAMRYWRETHQLPPVGETEQPTIPGVIRSTLEVIIRDGYYGTVHASTPHTPTSTHA